MAAIDSIHNSEQKFYRENGYLVARGLFTGQECDYWSQYFTDMVERGGDGWAALARGLRGLGVPRRTGAWAVRREPISIPSSGELNDPRGVRLEIEKTRCGSIPVLTISMPPPNFLDTG